MDSFNGTFTEVATLQSDFCDLALTSEYCSKRRHWDKPASWRRLVRLCPHTLCEVINVRFAAAKEFKKSKLPYLHVWQMLNRIIPFSH